MTSGHDQYDDLVIIFEDKTGDSRDESEMNQMVHEMSRVAARSGFGWRQYGSLPTIRRGLADEQRTLDERDRLPHPLQDAIDKLEGLARQAETEAEHRYEVDELRRRFCEGQAHAWRHAAAMLREAGQP